MRAHCPSHADPFASSSTSPPPDITVENHGTLFLLDGVSRRGSRWLFENLQPDHQHFGKACVVEPRYVEAIVRGAIDDGLRVL